MKDLVIFGCRAYAEIAHYYLQSSDEYRVVAFTVDGEYMEDTSYCGLPVVPFEELPHSYPASECQVFVAIGHQKVNAQRQQKVAEVVAKGYQLASYISPQANTSDDLVIGPNSIVMEHAIIQPFVRIGSNSVIWSATRMGFHCHVGDHCWIVSAIMGESVHLGDNSFVGLNATIAPKLKIGRANIVGAGALILNDTEDNQVFRGPASKASRVPSHRVPNF